MDGVTVEEKEEVDTTTMTLNVVVDKSPQCISMVKTINVVEEEKEETDDSVNMEKKYESTTTPYSTPNNPKKRIGITWTNEEDQKLREAIIHSPNGIINWCALAESHQRTEQAIKLRLFKIVRNELNNCVNVQEEDNLFRMFHVHRHEYERLKQRQIQSSQHKQQVHGRYYMTEPVVNNNDTKVLRIIQKVLDISESKKLSLEEKNAFLDYLFQIVS